MRNEPRVLSRWCFAAPSAAFLWSTAAARARGGMHHPVVSHDYAKEDGAPRSAREALQRPDPPDFSSECRMLGSRDYGAMLAVPEALDFFEKMGGERLCARNASLCRWAAEMLRAAWGGMPSGAGEEALAGATRMIGPPP
jgi:hypothetical protein